MTYQPLFIIGAARSGTNILRDTLTALPGWNSWPCDEINPIWRHGNLGLGDDGMSAAHARPEVARFIRGRFDRLSRKTGAGVIVEKTCANTLRVPFIDAIFPEARYIHIVRDGRDAALSASRRWTAPIESGYLARKLRFVPPADLPHYALGFLANRWRQARASDRRQSVWGPRFPQMDEWVSRHPLIEVCAKQWTHCVDTSDHGLAGIESDRVVTIRYEDFASAPEAALSQCETLIGRPVAAGVPKEALSRISASSVGAWRRHGDIFTACAHEIMRPTLARHGYDAAA